MLKVESLEFWRKATDGVTMTYIGDLARTEVVRIRSSGPVNVSYRPIDGEGVIIGEEEYIGTLDGDDAIRVTSPTGFQLIFNMAKSVLLTIYDDRQAFAAPSPDTESFTVYEKRGLESMDPLDIITHRQTVTKRLQDAVDLPNARERQRREGELESQLAAMAKRLGELEGKTNEKAQDSAGHTEGDAGPA